MKSDTLYNAQTLLEYFICVGTTMKTDFVTTPNGWTTRIRADPDPQVSSPILVSFFFYIYNEGSGTISCTTSTNSNKGMKINGHTPEVHVVILCIQISLLWKHTLAALLGHD